MMYSDNLSMGKSGIKQVDFYQFQKDFLLELEKIDIVNKCFLYDGESIDDLKNMPVNTRDGKFVNLYIDYFMGEPVKDFGNNAGVLNEVARFQVTIVGKKDINVYDDRFRNTSSICFEAKQKIYEILDNNYINNNTYFPADLGNFSKLFNVKFESENISIYTQEISFKISSYVKNK